MPIRISSQFRPMTYDELSKPLIQATEAQMALEDQYSAMQTEAAKWQQLANEQTDHRAYTQLKAYSDDLSAQADALLKQGLSPSTRAAMLDMKRRYSKDVTPIEQAYNKREALVNEQRKASLSNPSLLFERDASKISLDDFLLNPQLDYGKAYSGEEITKQVAQAVSSVAAGMKSIAMGQPLDKYTNTIIQKSGFTPEQIQYAIQNGQADDILIQIRDRVLNSTGIPTWGDQATQKRALDYANQGLYAGIGQMNIGTASNDVQRRNDNLADRNIEMLTRGFRYNKDTGQYEYDQSLAAQIATGKKGAKATTTTVTPKDETKSTFIGKDTITKKDIYKVVDQDGNEHICIKSGNNFYPVENPDDILLTKADNSIQRTPAQQNWIHATGGITAADKDEIFQDGADYFKSVLSDTDFYTKDGHINANRVKVVENGNLSEFSDDEIAYDKLQKMADDSKMDYTDLVFIKVKRNWGIDDDYFVIEKNKYNDLLQEIQNERSKSKGTKGTTGSTGSTSSQGKQEEKGKTSPKGPVIANDSANIAAQNIIDSGLEVKTKE